MSKTGKSPLDNNTMEDFNQAKQTICDIARRVYDKGFVAANEGNLSMRVADDRILITPTMHSKGFLTTDDICTINFDGQPLGSKRPSSEYRLHLFIYRQRPDINCVVHSHPPHASAFAVAREPIPTCVMPEPDIFLGEVPIAPYETPGNDRFAETIQPFVKSSNTIILANHGTVSFDAEMERAFWLTEILDAYCRILILAKQLGNVQVLSPEEGRELLQLRQKWGFSDPRCGDVKAESDLANMVQYRHLWPESLIKQNLHQSETSLSDLDVERIAQRTAALLRADLHSRNE